MDPYRYQHKLPLPLPTPPPPHALNSRALFRPCSCASRPCAKTGTCLNDLPALSDDDFGDVPSKRSKPSGSRASNDENETPPDAQHRAARKQGRGQQGRTESPPLRPASRRARAASPSDSDASVETAEDAGGEQTRQRGQRAQPEHMQAGLGDGDEGEDELGIQRRVGTPESEVQSEEDPAADAEDFEPVEARTVDLLLHITRVATSYGVSK